MLMDCGTIIICLASFAVPASEQLCAAKPFARLMSVDVLGPVLLLMVLFAVQQGLAVAVTHSMSWHDSNLFQIPNPHTVLST